MVTLDRAIERTAQTAGRDTLLLFTADHSFDSACAAASRASRCSTDSKRKKPSGSRRSAAHPHHAVRMDNGHTGEEVLVAAQGPGAERVRGYMSNTDIFGVMMDAFGWKR